MKNQLVKNSLVSIPTKDWNVIKQYCKDRSGVYRFINNVNDKYYIGSAVDLYNRIRDYHQPWYYVERANTLIVRAFLKYGMDNFTLIIIEYTTPEEVILGEQRAIDKYLPEYNILPIARNSLGLLWKTN